MNWRWELAQAAEIRWWRHYLRSKDTGKYLELKRAYWRRVLGQSGLHPAPQARVLDAGCGPAGIFLILEQQQVDALDPLLDRYAHDLPIFRPKRWPWVRFHTGALEAFRTAEPYDMVFCLNAINHVADLGEAFDRLTAALRPGGDLMISVDTHHSGLLKHLFRLFPGDILHPHQHALSDYLSMVEGRGCRIQSIHHLKKGWIFDYVMIVARKI